MMNMMEATDADSDAEFTAKGVKAPLWSGAAYSNAISKSMRAMMTGSKLRTGRQDAAVNSDTRAELFADAVARKDKEKMLDALAKDPSILRRSDADGWLPLHHVCNLRPNYRYIDMMTMMVNTYPESARCVDKNGRTPLHVLCENSCVTVQALGVFAASLEDLTLMQDNDGNLPLHWLCRNSSCDIGMIKKLESNASACTTINERLEDGSPLPSFATSEASSHDFVGKTLQQKTEDALADDSKGSRSKKHAQEQLEFMKKEQSLLRHTLLSTKSQLRDVNQARADLQLKMEELRLQMTSEVQQRKEAQLEAQVLARNHQAMTLQLHTTVQMLLNIVPLARKVYGAAADDFLSGALAQATGGAPPSCYPSDPTSLRRKSSPVQLLKTQLQHSVLAHGCVQKWANSTPSSALAAAESVSSDAKTNVNASRTEDPSNSEKKSHNQTGDSDSSAAAMA
ncbi:hypothetical protein JG687_00003898 [Phytophthora cactorum]|uniref:Ankyrin repeat-containing domain n=1 Tax=Phytophthora cactorum TaxID=29920 RepID=A0A8T1UUI3_9STRA|nr:hypothetical protein JG687_00003898 [Phytophthora cactorum]